MPATFFFRSRVADDLEHYPRWQPLLHPLGECEVKHGHKVSLVNFYDDEIGNRATPQKFREAKTARTIKSWQIAVPIALLLLTAGVGLYYRSHRNKLLTDKDRIVLADFANTTGDPVFDAPCDKDSHRSSSRHRFLP